VSDDVTVDYVSADVTDVAGFVGDASAFEEFKRIFEKFTPAEALTTQRVCVGKLCFYWVRCTLRRSCGFGVWKAGDRNSP
jgi:hypothetical protein